MRCLAIAALLLIATCSFADDLEAGFQNPPAAARPRVWWHWMNGNITQDGITEDLRWMKRAGIAGMQNFDASLATPQVVEKRLAFMTPEWQDAFHHAASLAADLDLELAIATSARSEAAHVHDRADLPAVGAAAVLRSARPGARTARELSGVSQPEWCAGSDLRLR